MGLRQAWREAWAETSWLRPNRVRYEGQLPVVELRGLDEHHPVRPPEKWKRVRILGGKVYVRGHDAANGLRECPQCAALVVDDAWAKDTHMKACHVHEMAPEEAGE